MWIPNFQVKAMSEKARIVLTSEGGERSVCYRGEVKGCTVPRPVVSCTDAHTQAHKHMHACVLYSTVQTIPKVWN
jgi:hypothetical protein